MSLFWGNFKHSVVQRWFRRQHTQNFLLVKSVKELSFLKSCKRHYSIESRNCFAARPWLELTSSKTRLAALAIESCLQRWQMSNSSLEDKLSLSTEAKALYIASSEKTTVVWTQYIQSYIFNFYSFKNFFALQKSFQNFKTVST